MLAHEYFHERVHIEKNHEFKRILLFIVLTLISALIYRFFCHLQEYEADRLAAQKCGKKAAIESLSLLKIREKKCFFSLHPETEKRIFRLNITKKGKNTT